MTERIIADDLHCETQCCRHYPRADGPKTNHTYRLSLNFLTTKHRLISLDALRNPVIVSIFFLVDDMVDMEVAFNDATRGEKKTTDDELFDSICVCSGGVENRNAPLCHFLHGDVVGPGSTPNNCANSWRNII